MGGRHLDDDLAVHVQIGGAVRRHEQPGLHSRDRRGRRRLHEGVHRQPGLPQGRIRQLVRRGHASRDPRARLRQVQRIHLPWPLQPDARREAHRPPRQPGSSLGLVHALARPWLRGFGREAHMARCLHQQHDEHARCANGRALPCQVRLPCRSHRRSVSFAAPHRRHHRHAEQRRDQRFGHELRMAVSRPLVARDGIRDVHGRHRCADDTGGAARRGLPQQAPVPRYPHPRSRALP